MSYSSIVSGSALSAIQLSQSDKSIPRALPHMSSTRLSISCSSLSLFSPPTSYAIWRRHAALLHKHHDLLSMFPKCLPMYFLLMSCACLATMRKLNASSVFSSVIRTEAERKAWYLICSSSPIKRILSDTPALL